MDAPIQFSLVGLFQWIFGILVATVIFFLYRTFQQNAEDKKTLMDRTNKMTRLINSLLIVHNANHPSTEVKDIFKDGGDD